MTDVTALADSYQEYLFDIDPLSPVLLGIDQTPTGLGSLSEAAEREQLDKLAEFVDRATSIDPDGLSAVDRVTRDVLIASARSRIEQLGTHAVEYTITDFFSGPAAGLLTVLPMVSVANVEQFDAQLERLAAIPAYLREAGGRHRAGVAAGRVPVQRLVQASIDHLDRYLADPGSDPLLRQEAPDDQRAERRAGLLADVVRPAFAEYRDLLRDEVLGHGRPDERPGLCHLAGGDAHYAAMARVHTTTDRTPQDLHDTGLAIIERLADEYRQLGETVFGTDDLREIFDRLRTDPALRWRDADELLDTARSAITRAAREAPKWFGRIPPHEWVVEPVPEAEAPGAAPAYYLQPAADGSRPGTYFANTYKVGERFRHMAEAVAFHEAVPGHHFQLSTALELTELPLLRRVGDFTAYLEGWGLYAERLAQEMGLYSDDVARLGMLSCDSMRAGRLVVDTGLHALGWSRQQAIDFLERNTPMAPVEIVSEIDRYIAYPGQALAYMVGRLEIQRLRAEAERELGERFDVRGFHDVVLGGGALPLSVLGDVVREWSASV